MAQEKEKAKELYNEVEVVATHCAGWRTQGDKARSLPKGSKNELA